MQYRIFPKIPGLPISVLGFGCMRLPIMGGDSTKIDEATATRLLRQAVDAGVNYIDTAYPYHGGQSEPVVGRALRDGYRARVQLATKLPTWRVATKADWERYLEEQLKRLDTSCIEFYLLHTLDAESWETVRRLRGLPALERARADGRIRHIGFSFHGSPDAFRKILDGYDWEFCQIQYNFLDEGYQAGTEGLRYAAARSVGVIAMEPLRGGLLAGKVPPRVRAVWARSGRPWSPAEWALRWVWNHPGIVTLLSGMGAADQLEENLHVADVGGVGRMTAKDLALVGEVRDYYHARMKVLCTTCGYCQPCPNDVDIPNAFAFYNRSAMFGDRESSGRFYRSFLVENGQGAGACVACGECEPKCPQAIPIVKKLKEAHAHLAE